MMLFTLLLFSFHLALSQKVVLITGATGRTGKLIYQRMKTFGDFEVRALVRNITTARSELNCNKCDQSEGIFQGDVTDLASLIPAAKGCDDLVIAVGISLTKNMTLVEEVEFKGVEKQVQAFVSGRVDAGSVSDLHVSFISSMGTTLQNPPPQAGGAILFWKLQAEAFIQSSGLAYTIIKPCGLTDDGPGQKTLLSGHDDSMMGDIASKEIEISRADVAELIVESVRMGPVHPGFRADVCSKSGTPTTNLRAFLEQSRWPWLQ